MRLLLHVSSCLTDRELVACPWASCIDNNNNNNNNNNSSSSSSCCCCVTSRVTICIMFITTIIITSYRVSRLTVC